MLALVQDSRVIVCRFYCFVVIFFTIVVGLLQSSGIMSATSRVFGVLVRFCRSLSSMVLMLNSDYAAQAPVIALYANLNTAVPVYCTSLVRSLLLQGDLH
jgi:hypothetical protein